MKTYLHVYVLCAHPQFHEKWAFLWPMQKRLKKCHEKAYFSTDFYHFYIDHVII
jgi:hypothetical protein